MKLTLFLPSITRGLFKIKTDIISASQCRILLYVNLLITGVLGLIFGVDLVFSSLPINVQNSAPKTAELSAFFYLISYGLLPLAVFWRLRKNALGLVPVCTLMFCLQSIRVVGEAAFWPYNPPVTISLPLTSFASGSGLMIDLYALFIAALLIFVQKDMEFSATANPN